MAFSGWRNSCPSASRNSSFSLPARSASMRAARSYSSRARSSSRDSFMGEQHRKGSWNSRPTLPLIRSKCGQHSPADNIETPAAQHTNVTPPIGQLFEVASRCQHFRAQAQLCCDSLIESAEFLYKRGARGIGNAPRVDWRRGVGDGGGANAFEQL